ncbi:hypothetical protein GE300_11770 [Rhodobacteraceae bacterium 2CG4]|uniref:DUF1468 domain-containing protein n=1 Tax=Halovulum marinum TaxID=2662447 RepID=A0A6L5Z1W5_9RHOB|nr:tripartite tricarboxylate transporter TctB family protein [Halovulum marinum]MSU90289.1 hypothetical protein [Halovulum marinum]
MRPTTQDRGAVRADLFSGAVVTLIGLGGLLESLRMPRFAERNADPYTVPGVTPGLISAMLLIFGVALLVRALRGRASGAGVSIHRWSRASGFRTVLTLALTLVYGLLLFGNIPFLPATVAFVFAFTLVLDWANPERRLPLAYLLPGAAVLAVAAGFGIEFVFKEVFLVRLPG